MSRLLLFLTLCLLIPMQAASAAPRYTVTDLGTLPGYAESRATCLNDRGEVAGYAAGSRRLAQDQFQNGTRAFLWSKGQMRLLPTIPSPFTEPAGTYDAVASGINNRGQVVGTLSAFFDGAWLGTTLRAVLWQQGKLQMIPAPARSNENTAIAINDAGQVAGTAYELDPPGQASPDQIYLYSTGQSQGIGPGCAMGLNDAGQVCGYVLLDKDNKPTSGSGDGTPFAQAQAVLCDGQSGERLILGDGYAFTLNQSSSVAGMRESLIDGARTPSLRTEVSDALRASVMRQVKLYQHDNKSMEVSALVVTDAFPKARMTLWRTGQGRSRADVLPGHWIPQSLNDAGQMVGGNWLRQTGQNYDLNQLLPTHSKWKITCATAINKRGQIAGYGTHNGHTRAFLLTPQ